MSRAKLTLAIGLLGALTARVAGDTPIERVDAAAPSPTGINTTGAGALRDEAVLHNASLHHGEPAADERSLFEEDVVPIPRRRPLMLPAGIVKSRNGATARVAPRHAAKFQCLVDWLDEQGFRIGAMTGFAQRPYGGSLHPIGGAIDIDQASRNYLTRGKRYPDGINAAAARCGLLHGDRHAWPRYPDYGHFQVAGVSLASHRRRRIDQAGPAYAAAGEQDWKQPAAQPTRRSVRYRSADRVATTSGASVLDVR